MSDIIKIPESEFKVIFEMCQYNYITALSEAEKAGYIDSAPIEQAREIVKEFEKKQSDLADNRMVDEHINSLLKVADLYEQHIKELQSKQARD